MLRSIKIAIQQTNHIIGKYLEDHKREYMLITMCSIIIISDGMLLALAGSMIPRTPLGVAFVLLFTLVLFISTCWLFAVVNNFLDNYLL